MLGALKTEVGALPAKWRAAWVLVRLPIALDGHAVEQVDRRSEHALQAAGTDAPVHPLNGALWLRLSAYAYNEIGDYERLGVAAGSAEATGD